MFRIGWTENDIVPISAREPSAFAAVWLVRNVSYDSAFTKRG